MRIIDVSHHQPSNKIDWAKAAHDIDLVIIRVQYGSKKVDREYKNHVSNCKMYGIPFGHYAYGRFVSVADAKVEAKDFLSRIDKDAKFLALDTEKDTIDACGTKNVAEASQAFIDVCQAAGYKTGFYVSHHLYHLYGLNKVKADFLWIPRYGKNDGTANKNPDFACCLWQYTDRGRVNWYGSNLDFNILHGDKDLEWFIDGGKTVNFKEEVVGMTNPFGNNLTYKVKSGDTLSAIANKYNTTISKLLSINNISNPDKIYVGQVLEVLGTVSETTLSGNDYIIKSGDTLSSIALKNNTTVKQLQAWNNIKNANKIYAGQKIRVT
jgi:LysM repeat protein/GH25 family lysozyme M1 (1,4-beta-N-acetylmuramidase)